MDTVLPNRSSAARRLVVLFTLFFFFLLIAGGIGAAIGMIPGLPLRYQYLLSSVVQCLLAFCVPAWFTAKFSTREAPRFLALSTSGGWRPFVGVLIVYCLALPAMNQIIYWNNHIPFPEWAAGLETTLRSLEEANGKVAETMLDIHTLWQFIVTVAVVGLLTGFSEELFFRGALQNIFTRGGVKAWVAVWGAAVIFSTMHFQFFGFVPRMLMGAFFGYLLLWSGSLWPAIFAHALNNSIVVVGAWLGDGNSVVDNFGIASSEAFPVAALASAVATGLFFWKFRNYFFKRENNG